VPSNRFRGIIEINLDKPRHLRFTLGSFIALEEQCGLPLATLEGAKKTPKVLRDLLWSGLIHEDPELTREVVGNLVGIAELADLWDAVTKALKAATDSLGEAQLARLRAAAGAAGEKAPIKSGAIELRGHGKKRSS